MLRCNCSESLLLLWLQNRKFVHRRIRDCRFPSSDEIIRSFTLNNYFQGSKLFSYKSPVPAELPYPVALMKDNPFAEQEVSYPHSYLDEKLILYEEYSCKF